MTCPDAEPLIARFSDDSASLKTAERQHLEQHLVHCAACRALIEDQRHVARVLHARPPVTVPPAFAARVAARLDAEQGWLALGNWRRWTATLAPVAAALVFAAWMGGSTPAPASLNSDDAFDAWTMSNGTGESAALVMQSSTSDALLEALLTGAAASPGEVDAR